MKKVRLLSHVNPSVASLVVPRDADVVRRHVSVLFVLEVVAVSAHDDADVVQSQHRNRVVVRVHRQAHHIPCRSVNLDGLVVLLVDLEFAVLSHFLPTHHFFKKVFLVQPHCALCGLIVGKGEFATPLLVSVGEECLKTTAERFATEWCVPSNSHWFWFWFRDFRFVSVEQFAERVGHCCRVVS